MSVTVFVVQGDGITISGDSKITHKNAPFSLPIQKSDSYPICGSESGCRATWSECGRHWHKEKTTADGAVQATEV